MEPPAREVTVRIDAPADRLYAIVADVTRMGELSPECYRCEWLDGATVAAPGARFRGHNRRGLLRWSTVAEVETAVPGRELVFATRAWPRGPGQATRWTYRFEPAGEATDVTERCEIVRFLPVLRLFESPEKRLGGVEQGMRTTLERLKAAAEQG